MGLQKGVYNNVITFSDEETGRIVRLEKMVNDLEIADFCFYVERTIKARNPEANRCDFGTGWIDNVYHNFKQWTKKKQEIAGMVRFDLTVKSMRYSFGFLETEKEPDPEKFAEDGFFSYDVYGEIFFNEGKARHEQREEKTVHHSGRH